MYARHEDDDFRTTAATGAFARLVRAASEQLASWKRTQDEIHAARALAMMDEHLLRDIGASGRNVERLVRYGRDDD